MIIICMDLWILDVVLPFLEVFGCNLSLSSLCFYEWYRSSIHSASSLWRYLLRFFFITSEHKTNTLWIMITKLKCNVFSSKRIKNENFYTKCLTMTDRASKIVRRMNFNTLGRLAYLYLTRNERACNNYYEHIRAITR